MIGLFCLLGFCALVFVLRLLTCLYRWIHMIHMKSLYEHYLIYNPQKFPLNEYRLKSSLEKYHDSSSIHNFGEKGTSSVKDIMNKYDVAIGYYKECVKQVFFPNYWIERIKELPKRTAKYLGIPASKVVAAMSLVFLFILSSIGVLDIIDRFAPGFIEKFIEIIY